MPRESAVTWLKRVREGQAVLKRWVEKSDPFVRAYNGVFPNSLQGEGAENIDSNFVLAVTRSYVSQLFFRNPKITVPPRRPEDLKHAHLASAVINRVIEESKAEVAFQAAMTDAVLRGGGWVKLGYHTESAPKPDEDVVLNSADEDIHRENEKLLMNLDVEVQKDEDHDKHAASHQALLDDPQVMANIIGQFGEEAALKIIAHIEEHKRLKKQVAKEGRLDWRVAPEQVWCRHVDPRDVIIDSNATRLEDARWIAFRSVRTIRSIKRDPAYQNTSSLEGSMVTPHQEFGLGSTPKDPKSEMQEIQQAVLRKRGNRRKGPRPELLDPDDERIELFEVWDRQTERVMVVTDQSDRFLRNDISPYLNVPGFFPAVQLTFNNKLGTGGDAEAERAYGYSLVEPWWSEQLELNKLESLRLCIAKHNVPKYLADASLSDESLRKISRGDVGTIVKLANTLPDGTKDPRLIISAIGLQTASIDIHQAIRTLKDEISFKSGLGEIQLGGQSTARTATATQVQVASQSAGLDKMLDHIENAFQQIARVARSMVRQYFTTERTVALTGPEGQEWASYLGADLYGDEILVETRTSAASNKNLRQFQALQLYNLLAQNPAVKLRELTDYVLREHGVPTPATFLKTDEEIQAELAAQQAAQEGGAGGPVDVSVAQQAAPTEGRLARQASGDKLQSGLTF